MRSRNSRLFDQRILHYADYLARQAGAETSWRFIQAVEETTAFIIAQPELGQIYQTRRADLADLRF